MDTELGKLGMKFRMNRTALAVSQAITCLALAACGGAGGSDEPEASLLNDEANLEKGSWGDTTAPTVSITGTIAGSSANVVGLKGNAADNRRLYRVRWANDRGAAEVFWESGATR